MQQYTRIDASLSDCGRYRFTLVRQWDERPMLVVCMLNPSRADHKQDDPTITLLCQIASHNGYGGVLVVNLCPLRSSQPADAFAMLDAAQVDGDVELRRILWQNLRIIEVEIQCAGALLIAWGANGGRAGDWYSVTMQTVREHRPRVPIFHLGKCANGHPKHPLARGKHKVPKDAPLIPWGTTP